MFGFFNKDFKCNRRTARHTKLDYSKFESRRVLAGSVFNAGTGELFIGGTPDNDSVEVRQSGGQITVVQRFFATQTFQASQVTKLTFVGIGGDDYFLNETALPLSAWGGNGDDVIIGGSANDFIQGNAGNDEIRGRDGNDFLVAALGNDKVYGGDGDDRIAGNVGANELYGENGNDTIYGGEDRDMIFGGAGNDFLFGFGGNDTILGGAGNDFMMGLAGSNTIDGEQGNDTVYGSEEGDNIFGGDGDDLLIGRGGNDTIDGGEGNDTQYGGNGNDNLLGGNGDDRLVGGDGNDRLDGGVGNDQVWGERGDDTLLGGTGNDLLIGDAGRDRLFGGLDSDTLFGGAGNDVLYGGLGADNIYGQAGNDLMHGGELANGFADGDNSPDLLHGGDGSDTVRMSGLQVDYRLTTSGVSRSAQDLRNNRRSNNDTMRIIESLVFADGPEIQNLEIIYVQPVIAANSNGSNRSTYLGTAAQEQDIKNRINAIYRAAGIQVNWLSPKIWNNSTANVGSGGAGNAVTKLQTIVNGGDNAGVGSSNSRVVDLYFVDSVPSHGTLSERQMAGFAFLNQSGVAVRVGSELPGFEGGRLVVSQVVAHEIAHNLGLVHVSDGNNLMNENSNQGNNVSLTRSQINTLIASPISQPV